MTLRMKLLKAIRFLMLSGILLLLSGCISESLDGCPLDILLRFTYKPQGSIVDLFGERVQRVTLCVYRTDGTIEHTQVLEKSDLNKLQGVEMYLPQGNYNVVLWANALDTNTKLAGFGPGENISQLFASHPQAESSPEIPTLDRLLFVAAPLSVNENEPSGDRVVNFSPVTMRLNVVLDGVSVKPIVRIPGMASALQPKQDEETGAWKVQPVEQGKTFVPTVTYDATAKHAEAVTDVPRFKADTPSTVELIDPNTGNLIVPAISIAELIRKYDIKLGEENEVTITIQISFGGGHAKITVKEWEHNPIHPGGL